MSLFEELSLKRFLAVVRKEFVQMRRDRLTFAMMFAIPIIQLVIFGFAINADPRSLPTATIIADQGPEVRTFLWSLKNSGYFSLKKSARTEAEGQNLLSQGEVQFVVNIPAGFTRRLHRGEKPQILVEVDAADPAATSNAIAAIRQLASSAFSHDFKGPLDYLMPAEQPIDLRIHALYNPEIKTHYNIVPGLMGVVLTMTMVMITGLAITRERERGTMENLLSTPAKPIEVMAGKIVPYILVGYVQVAVIMIAARLVFHVPFSGSVILLLIAALLFIAANLAIGLTFSTIATNGLQAMQMSFFFFLPSMLLSGFMFPFRGMPVWAQYAGEILPLTHFLRVIRGILLKGNGPSQILSELLPIAVFAVAAFALGIKRFRRTLD